MTQPSTPARSGRPKAYGRFYTRAFVSIMMIGFLALFTLSGLALYAAPSGSLANALGWTLVGLGRGQWEALHVAFGFLWVPLALLHLAINLKVVGGYLRDRARRAFVWRRELVAALTVTALLGIASVLGLPPVAQVVAWGEGFNGFWAERADSVVTTPSGGTGDGQGAGMGRFATVDPASGALTPVGQGAGARAEGEAPSPEGWSGPRQPRLESSMPTAKPIESAAAAAISGCSSMRSCTDATTPPPPSTALWPAPLSDSRRRDASSCSLARATAPAS